MDARLEIFTLGGVRILRDGELLRSLSTRKTEALLIYLASTRRPQPREVLADLFWDERSQSQAMANLRVVLTTLRQVLGDSIIISRNQVELNPAAPVWLDATELENSLEAVRKQGGLSPSTAEQASAALALYRGDFLQGFSVFDCRRFEDWGVRERERLHRLAVDGLSELLTYQIERQGYQQGMANASRLLELDPLMEAAHRQMMRLLTYSGQRAAALNQYETCQKLLQDELEVEPSVETRELYEQIKSGQPGAIKEPGKLPLEKARLPRQVGRCPYRGLSAFQEADAPFYFGREAFLQALEQAIHKKKLVAVIVGSSGAGKSSALFAGLLPRLRKTAAYQLAIFRPGSQPFYALAGALLPLLESGLSETDRMVETRKLAERLAQEEVSLAQVVERILEKTPQARQVLLVVDQFEELYTLCPEASIQKAFIDELLTTLQAARVKRGKLALILIALRADFMGQALAYRPFADALQDASQLMGPMTRQELHMAVEKPAEMQGAAFEPGLVERILDDVGEKPGNLPLLEFTLTQLWEQQSDGWLTHADYEAMGCVEGALAAYADQVYNQLEADEQELARRALVQLVQPGEGTEDTRRIASRDELGQASWSLVQHLADCRLVVTGWDPQGRQTAEVVHEALIQKWGRFQEWMDAGRAFRAWQERLRSSLRQWQASDHDEGALLRGAPLVEAEGWLEGHAEELNPEEVEFIQLSAALREREAVEREAQRQRELEAAQELAETQSQAATRLRRRAVYLLAALGLAAILAVVAVAFGQRANQNARLGFSRELAAAALTSLTDDQERAVLLAMQALEQADTRQAEEALHRTVQELRILNTLERPGVWIGLDWSPDGQQLAASGTTGAAVWDPDSGKILYTKEVSEGMINRLAFSPDGSMLLLPSEGGDAFAKSNVSIWEANTGQELLTFAAHDAFVQHASFSPDGTQFATASGDGTFKVWNLAKTLASGEGKSIMTVTFGEETAPIAVWFSPDGAHLATYNHDGWIHYLDVKSSQELWQFPSNAVDFSFSPDGERIVVSSSVGMLDVLEASTGKRLSLTRGHTLDINSILFSPDGTRLATACKDGAVKVWAFSDDTLSPLLTLSGHKDQAVSLAFSPDGGRLASGGRDGTVRIWDISSTGSVEPVMYQHLAAVQSVAISPDGTHVVTGAGVDGGNAIIWDTLSAKPLHTLSGQDWIWRTVYNPDGELLATASRDATLKLWDTATGTEISTLAGHEQQPDSYFFRGVLAAAFSPDGTRLATAGGDGAVRVWDVAALRKASLGIGDELLSLEEPGELKYAIDVAFSPDGRWIAAALGFWTDSMAVNSEGEMIRVWDAATNQLKWAQSSEPHYGYMTVSFSPDGQRLAAGDLKGQATVWKFPEGDKGDLEKLFTIKAGNFFVLKLNFSPDGTQLAVPSSEGMRIWDANTGEPIGTLPHPGTTVEAVYSQDGKRLVTAGMDGFGRLFFMDINELASMAKSRLTRTLSTEECQKYLHMRTCPEAP